MTDEHFSQKEMMVKIMSKLEETHDTLIKHIAQEDAHLQEIVAQVTRTNGRVTKLEDEVDVIQVKTENMAVKVGAFAFVASIIAAEVINKFL